MCSPACPPPSLPRRPPLHQQAGLGGDDVPQGGGGGLLGHGQGGRLVAVAEPFFPSGGVNVAAPVFLPHGGPGTPGADEVHELSGPHASRRPRRVGTDGTSGSGASSTGPPGMGAAGSTPLWLREQQHPQLPHAASGEGPGLPFAGYAASAAHQPRSVPSPESPGDGESQRFSFGDTAFGHALAAQAHRHSGAARRGSVSPPAADGGADPAAITVATVVTAPADGGGGLFFAGGSKALGGGAGAAGPLLFAASPAGTEAEQGDGEQPGAGGDAPELPKRRDDGASSGGEEAGKGGGAAKPQGGRTLRVGGKPQASEAGGAADASKEKQARS